MSPQDIPLEYLSAIQRGQGREQLGGHGLPSDHEIDAHTLEDALQRAVANTGGDKTLFEAPLQYVVCLFQYET